MFLMILSLLIRADYGADQQSFKFGINDDVRKAQKVGVHEKYQTIPSFSTA